MVKYNVTIKIEESLAAEWLQWMRNKHIPDVMETGFFETCSLQRLKHPIDEDPGATFSIQYSCKSRELLEKYFEEHAARLMQDHTDRYRNKFVAFRTILEEIESF